MHDRTDLKGRVCTSKTEGQYSTVLQQCGSNITPMWSVKGHKPGPGWSRRRDGGYQYHPFTFADFPGARVVAVIFKTLAVVIVGIGILAAVELSRSTSISGHDKTAAVAGVVGGTIIAASAMAFFGYLLQLLVTIHFDVRFSDSEKLANDLEASQKQPAPQHAASPAV